MRHQLVATSVVVLALCGLAVAKAAPRPSAAAADMVSVDAPAAADHPLTGRYEGSIILGQSTKAFDSVQLPSGKSAFVERLGVTVKATGKVTRTVYVSPQGRTSHEVFSNYREKLVAGRFVPVFECEGSACGPEFLRKFIFPEGKSVLPSVTGDRLRESLLRDAFFRKSDLKYGLFQRAGEGGKDYAVLSTSIPTDMIGTAAVLNDRVAVFVQLVEAAGMERKMVTLKAEDISGDIARQGRAVFYGILFDFDKAQIKPESEPQLVEMAKALKADPKLKVFIVGHTDNQGKLDYNTGLSQRRAEAVARALTTGHGIPAARLTAKGLASLAPVATNRTDEGRAKNRRVEMVEQ